MTLLIILAVFAALVLFLVFPSLRKHKDRELLRGKYIAHRGLHDDKLPENSLAAFRAATEQGYAIENDIHLTADGEVVVFHDDTLKRMCGADGRVEEKTLAELKELRLGNTDEQIPTLKECLDLVDGRVPLLVEFKVSGNTTALCEAADKILSEYKGDYLIQSFYPQVLCWYRKNHKEVCRGQLATTFKGDKAERRLLGLMMLNFISRPDFVSYEHKYGKHVMRRLATLLGAMPVAWTIRSKEALDNCRKDFDAYIFENFIP